MTYLLLSNICTKNYWNRTTTVEIIVCDWVVSFFETHCSLPSRLPQARECLRCVWNGLPQYVTTASSLSTFRRRLKTHLFQRCFP